MAKPNMMEKNMKSMDPILMDLWFEILLRLPVKSVARSVCVSKLWQKIIRSDEFIKSYLLRSSSNKLPRLLCAKKIYDQGDWYFFTKSAHVLTPPVPQELDLPKPQSKVVKEPSQFVSSSSVCHSEKWCSENPSYAHGLISYVHGNNQIICNPSIGKYITLPEPPCNDKHTLFSSILGYDPSNGQYKVLAFLKRLGVCYHQVLTLGAQNCSWKVIQCNTPHYPAGTRHVCIEGVLYYYTAFTMCKQFLVRFDLRTESLEVVSVIPEAFDSSSSKLITGYKSLINYNGKVAVVNKNRNIFHLWVLEDAKKQKWSNKRLTFPEGSTRWRFHEELEILGTSDMGEIVFKSTSCFEDVNNVVYFLDQKSNRIRSVELEGSTNHEFTFLHFVESLMFL